MTSGETIIKTPGNVEEKLLLDTLPDILGEAKANTLSDTPGDREAHTLVAT